MSYCHYWGRPAELDAAQFLLFSAECKKLRGALPSVRIGNADGFAWPSFSADQVCFNGKPPMEALLIRRSFHRQERGTAEFGLYWDYVKTNQRPYDALVVAVLISLKHHFADAALSSDGGAADWAEGMALYERCTGRTPPSLPELARPAGQQN